MTTETKKPHSGEGRTWPGYLFGGRLRTSTLALVIAFCAIWWLYVTYQPEPHPREQVPAVNVVPPGFIPDPSYTWVPRTDVQQRTAAPTTTTTSTAVTTPSITSAGDSTTPTSSPPTSSDQSASTSETPQPSTTASTTSMVPLPPLIHPTTMPSRPTSATPTS